MTLFLIFFFQALYFLIAHFSAKSSKTDEDYFLAGRSVSFFPLMMTLVATQIGGGKILGAADEAYLYGWSVLLFPIGASLGLVVLGTGVGAKLAKLPISTIAELFETVYSSSGLRKCAGALSVISLFLILVAQIKASHMFLQSLGVSSTLLFILFWTVVIYYTSQGGIKAVINTDLFQACFFIIVFTGCLIYTLYFLPEIPQTPVETLPMSFSKFSGWLLMPLLFLLIEQDMAQRCFSGATPKIVSRSALFAGLATCIFCFIPIFFGILAARLGIQATPGSSILMTAITQLTNPLMASLVGCAILAAIISTVTSLINAISANISHDFLKQSLSMKSVKLITYATSIASILIALFSKSVISMLILSYDLSVSCLFVPIIFAIFRGRGNYNSALLSILFGASAFVALRIIPFEGPKEITCVIISLAGFGLGEAHSRKNTLKSIIVKLL